MAALGLAGALATGGAMAASASVVNAEGGRFDHGVDYGYMVVWSNYSHGSKAHGSTACSSVSCTRSDRVPAGRTSYADRGATFGGNSAYYWF
jgi:lactococcin 972 family bacteriocin